MRYLRMKEEQQRLREGVQRLLTERVNEFETGVVRV
jgi:hypothetical protein